MITLEQYREAKQKLEKIDEESDKLNKVQQKEKSELTNKYWEIEREIGTKKLVDFRQLEKKHKEAKDKPSKKSQPHAAVRNEFSRIMQLMEIHKEEHDLKFRVYVYKGGSYPNYITDDYKPIDTIKDDKYAKIQAFIVKDEKKPKNKFALIIVGKSIFNCCDGRLIDLPHYYGQPCHTNYENISLSITNRPLEDTLKKYYNRNKHKILKEFLEEHKKLEQEYETVIKATNTLEWELAYWENKKDDYENHYSRGTEMDEYKEVLKNIEKIKARIPEAS